VPAFFSRVFDLNYAAIGLVAALTGGAAVGVGLVAGGFIADFLGARRASWYALVPAAGLAIATPVYIAAFLQGDWLMTAVLLGLAGFFQYLSFGPTLGVIQNVVTDHRRATATALVYVALNVVALGGGALFTGWLIDRFADLNLAHSGHEGPSFRLLCPGGQALASAAEATRALCRSTLAQSSRQGILVTLLFYAWAAVHYVLGSMGLERQMRGTARSEV
jgi:MFS family permease